MNVAALQFSRSMGRTSRLTFDPVLVSSALALLLLGLVMVTSASISIADRELGSPFAFLERQLLFASVGCCLGLVAFALPTEVWERVSFALLLIGLALLVLVLIPGLGHAVNGSRRWLRIGMFNFQASELARAADPDPHLQLRGAAPRRAALDVEGCAEAARSVGAARRCCCCWSLTSAPPPCS